jgi:hypothetical protein
MKILEALAERGSSFVLAHAPKSELAGQAADVALSTHATVAHDDRTLAIEEVTGLQPDAPDAR